MPNEKNSPFDIQRALGRNLRIKNDYGGAAAAYMNAAKLLPKSQCAIFAAMALRDGGDIEGAISILKSYTATNPEDFDGLATLGVIFKKQKRFAEAVSPMRAAVNLRNNDTSARNTLTTSLWSCGRIEEAKEEGLANLTLKDKLAFESFKASPYCDYKLKEGGRGFDPEDRRRNIISFSLWGDNPIYVTGAIVNAQIAQHIYVRWTPRFYCDTSVPADARAALTNYGAQVVLMDKPEHSRIRPMWRFLASDDPDVNVFICRDADSRLNAKELLAVSDWLKSGKRFHIMRDHVYHMELILAGMWGGMAGVLPDMADWLSNAAKYFDNKFADQAFLGEVIWPMIRSDAQIHDTFYRFPNASAFPDGYNLPDKFHVGGGGKIMPHWSKLIAINEDKGS